MARRTVILVVAACWAALSAAGARAAETTVYNVSQLRDALNAADPGDRIYMAPGSYTGRLWVTDVHGTADDMIEVVALDPTNRPVFTSDDAACFTLYNCSYVLVDGLIAEHGGTPTQDANNIEFPHGSHMVLKNALSRDLDHDGNSDGVKFARSDNVLMYNCTVASWADGGSANDQMVSRNSLMMRNLITFPDMTPNAGANGTQPKGDSYRNGYYKNVFLDGSSRCIQFGGAGGVDGWEGHDMVAMGNVIDGGEAAAAYVSCQTCELSYNTIVDPTKWVMRILNEGGWAETGTNTFKRNLVVYGPLSSIQNVGSGTRPETFTYAENYWYNRLDPAASIPALPGGQTDPAGGTDPQLDADYRPLHPGAQDYGAHAPAMEAAWARHTGSFQWAWEKAMAYEPVADAGGRYSVAPGLSIELDASGSVLGAASYGTNPTAAYAWDVDVDGVADDAATTLTYDDLTGDGPGQLGLAAGLHAVELRMARTDEYGTILDWDLADLLVLDELIPGDASVDGTVDVLDLAILANHFGESPAGWREGDVTGDGLVDVLDLAALANHFGETVGGGAPAPEPSALAFAALGAGAALLRRRRARPEEGP